MTYTAPTVEIVGSLEDLTLVTNKGDKKSPDGFKYHHVILTSV